MCSVITIKYSRGRHESAILKLSTLEEENVFVVQIVILFHKVILVIGNCRIQKIRRTFTKIAFSYQILYIRSTADKDF